MDQPLPKGIVVGGRSAFSIDGSWRDKAVLIGRIAETNYRNIHWYFIMTIRWMWPPVHWVRSFVIDGGEEL